MCVIGFDNSNTTPIYASHFRGVSHLVVFIARHTTYHFDDIVGMLCWRGQSKIILSDIRQIEQLYIIRCSDAQDFSASH